jgi:hypothetical protein
VRAEQFPGNEPPAAGPAFPLACPAPACRHAPKDKEAVAELNEAVKRDAQGGTWADYLFLAMAQQRLGRADEARKWLERAGQALDKEAPADWGRRLQQEVLRREAEQLLRGAADTPGQPGKGP